MQESSNTNWHSKFLEEDDHSAADRGRALGALTIAGAIAAAIIKCLANPDEPFPVLFCSVCGIIAILALLLSIICSNYLHTKSVAKAFLNLKSIVVMGLALLAIAGLTYQQLFYAKVVYAKAVKSFESILDHVDYIQQVKHEQVRSLAIQDLTGKYSTEEINQAYVDADLRAIENQDYTGKGFFLATEPRPDDQEASVIITNKTDHEIVVNCDGPSMVQLPIQAKGKDTFYLKPGDYITTVSIRGNYNLPPLAARKRVVAAIRYKGTIVCNEQGQLEVGTIKLP